MNYQSQLSDSLIEQNQSQVQIPNFLFEQGRSILIKKNQIKMILSIIKYVFGMLLIISKFMLVTEEINLIQQHFRYSLQYIDIWLYITVIHSFISMVQYRVIQKYLNKYSIILFLAVKMGLVNIISIEQGLDQQQQQQQIEEQNDYQNQQLIGRLLLFDQRNIFVSKLSQEIYEKLQDKFKCLKILNKLLVIAFFFIQLLAVIILFNSDSLFLVDRLFYFLCMLYMILVVLFGLNQYFKTFVLVLLWIVFSPVLICYEIYKCCKRRKEQNLEKKKILKDLKEILYDQSKDHMENTDCAICMQILQNQEKVIVLSCSEKHVFHTDCIVDWLKLNLNCPLCRKQVIDEI
ncbi:unnamed protein product [Paramecium primaurelia]|uniref:RING-type domain-containing protein n=1 Tax=Paramecium primaurelia TaxID=5886 RepID=A0A8S1KCX3_PARPR|nr:unnamed protein product [Paramecium primaurelia]